jgi:glutamate racemase
MLDKRDLPIGFLDSGLGGISVLKKTIQLMPEEDYIYFGDSANAPYGEKNKEDIVALAEKTRHYCNLLITQSESWLSEEEGAKNARKRSRKQLKIKN